MSSNSIQERRRAQPLISIVLTTFNSKKVIVETLNGILRQDFPLNLVELIIVDDGSKDGTLKIVQKFIAECGTYFNDTKLIVHEKNYGVSRARNDGLRASKGDYILILDHDVIMNENTLRVLYSYLSNAPQKVAAVVPLHINVCGSRLTKWFEKIAGGKIMKTNAVTSCCLIRRHVVDEVGYYDETLGPPFTIYEDIEYGARVMRRGYEIHLLGHHSVLHYTCEDIEFNEEKTTHKAVSGLRQLFAIMEKIKSIYKCSYYFALRKYIRSLPLKHKTMWYIYAALGVLSFTLPVVNIYLLDTLIISFLTLAFIAFVGILQEYWNPKTLHLSLAYSIIALTWRVIRATTLPLNLLRCRNTKT